MHLINLRFVGEENRVEQDSYVLVEVADADYGKLVAEITDSLASYMDNAFDYNTKDPYGKAVSDVMNASGRKWIPVKCDTILI